MHNELFKLGPVTIYSYGLMIGIGILCGLFVAIKRANKKGLDANIVYALGFVALVFGFIGAKLLYCMVQFNSLLSDPLQTLSGSGFVVYGGIVGGILSAMIYCKAKGISFLQYFDLILPSVAIAQGFGRIGCFFAGCCYGRQTDFFISAAFHNSSIAPNGIRLIPTQLFSSAGDFLIATVLLIYARRPRRTGNVGALYLILYSIGRFIIEYFRGDYRGDIGILSTSQFISVFIMVIGIVVFFSNRLPLKKKENAA